MFSFADYTSMDYCNGPLSSGEVVPTTENIVVLATKLATSSNRFRTCAIAIANNTEFNLATPHRHFTNGMVVSMPLIIKPGRTGLVLTCNRPGLTEGSTGIISYNIERRDPFDLRFDQLQILWSLPFDLNINSAKVNVRVGVESASPDIFYNMLTGGVDYGELLTAERTHAVVHTPETQFDIEVYMGSGGKCPLAVSLTRAETERE